MSRNARCACAKKARFPRISSRRSLVILAYQFDRFASIFVTATSSFFLTSLSDGCLTEPGKSTSVTDE